MKTKYEVVDNAYNRSNYPDIIGQIFDNPPGYANVRLIKEKTPMEEIFRMQSKMFSEPSSKTMLEDFAIKCIKAGYDKDEIVEGIREFYRQSPEVGRSIVDRAVINYMGIEDKLSMKKTFNLKTSQFQAKMMPGQTPYTEEELKNLYKHVSDAAEGDPGEKEEEKVLKEKENIKNAIKTTEANLKNKLIKELSESLKNNN